MSALILYNVMKYILHTSKLYEHVFFNMFILQLSNVMQL